MIKNYREMSFSCILVASGCAGQGQVWQEQVHAGEGAGRGDPEEHDHPRLPALRRQGHEQREFGVMSAPVVGVSV